MCMKHLEPKTQKLHRIVDVAAAHHPLNPSVGEIKEALNKHHNGSTKGNAHSEVNKTIVKHDIGSKIDKIRQIKQSGGLSGEEEKESRKKRNKVNLNLFVSCWFW